MLFASLDFLLFLVPVFAGYWALARRPLGRALWLLAASYFFYAAGPKPATGPLPPPWTFVGLLVGSTFVNYLCALGMPRAGSAAKKTLLGLSLLFNLGLLGTFKYAGFALEATAEACQALGIPAHLPTLRLALPIGISFYTFQSLSYTINVYRGRLAPERNPIRFALFVALFPQLVAGPIVRASELLPQLGPTPSLMREDVDFAIFRIAKGIVKKVVFADFVAASFTDRVFASPTEFKSLENLLALLAFTLQIYADFSGYSDIAIGTARLFGFRLPENFARPYQAVDVADFWRRWHITLSSWLRDYVYYPLGGSRLGRTRTLVNLAITMLLVGIWHGAGWTFVAYAFCHAFAMVFNRVCRTRTRGGLAGAASAVGVALSGFAAAWLLARVALRLPAPLSFALAGGALALLLALLPSAEKRRWLTPLHVVLTLGFSVLTRVFFRADDIGAARAMAEKLAYFDGFAVRDGLFGNEPLAAWLGSTSALSWAKPFGEQCVLVVIGLGFALHYVPAGPLERFATRLIGRAPAPVVGLGVATVLGVTALLLSGPRANIYFAF